MIVRPAYFESTYPESLKYSVAIAPCPRNRSRRIRAMA
jgi:hypothetical protein